MANVTFEPIKEKVASLVHVSKHDLINDPEVAKAVMAELEKRGALIFPRLNLTDEEQLAVTDALGTRGNFSKKAPGADASAADVYTITLDKKLNNHPEYVRGTFFWHVDGVTIDHAMPKATLLSARAVSDKGGETEFANLYAAWEGLPQEEKDELDGLRVMHTIGASVRDVVPVVNEENVSLLNLADDMIHPLVWTHPDGRKSLLVGTTADHIEGLTLAHGRSILRRLTEWAAQPDYSYAHKWQEGDFAVWDNCGVMHRVRPYPEDSGRRMHRTTIAGDAKVAGSEKGVKHASLALTE